MDGYEVSNAVANILSMYTTKLLRSNHGTYFYNQLASLQILIGDTSGAINSTNSYFSKQYMDQIDSSGEQVGNVFDVLAASACLFLNSRLKQLAPTRITTGPIIWRP